MNIPNLLTLLRIFLVPVVVIFLIQGSYVKALIVFSIAGLTDALDGALARFLKCQTILGAFLDPIADKLLIAASFITMSILGIIPSWLTVIVVSRDFIILLGIAIMSIMSVPYAIKPSLISKLTTALQIVTIFMSLIFQTVTRELTYDWIMIICWITAFFTVASGLSYVARGIKLTNSGSL